MDGLNITQLGDHFCGRFTAMASPCDVLVDTRDARLAARICEAAYNECRRVEHKYSRYRQDNLMWRINQSNGKPVNIDAETRRLLDFADTCYQLSDGLFDITSGVLRQVWKFDGSDNVPAEEAVHALLPHIGWPKVQYDDHRIVLPEGFELDFGGIGKEYAVDAAAKACQQIAGEHSVLVNFGGDIQVTRPRSHSPYWQVGIETPGKEDSAGAVVNIAHGGLATSGDAKRFLLKDNIRYSHILNPRTGFPVADAPRSVTVAADHCIQSGLLATLALLQGANAESFLQQQGVTYWCHW